MSGTAIGRIGLAPMMAKDFDETARAMLADDPVAPAREGAGRG